MRLRMARRELAEHAAAAGGQLAARTHRRGDHRRAISCPARRPLSTQLQAKRGMTSRAAASLRARSSTSRRRRSGPRRSSAASERALVAGNEHASSARADQPGDSRAQARGRALMSHSRLVRAVAQLLLLLRIATGSPCCRTSRRRSRPRLMDHQQVVRAEVTTAIELPPDRVAALQRPARPPAGGAARGARRSVDHRRRGRRGSAARCTTAASRAARA